MKLTSPLRVYLPDTRGVVLERYGLSNTKLGPNVFTYSRMPGDKEKGNAFGTCPGSTDECEEVCYAKRIVGIVQDVYETNSLSADVPPIPAEAKLLRLHVSGDFDTVTYIQNWIGRPLERPDVIMWVYTRSWRVPELLPALEQLRALPNVQMFASLDKSCTDMPPTGWRRSWMNDGDKRIGEKIDVVGLDNPLWNEHNRKTFDGSFTYTCPEETGRKATCEECRYCFDGKINDVTFLVH